MFLAARCVRRTTRTSCIIVLSGNGVSTRKAPLRLGGACANSCVALCNVDRTSVGGLNASCRILEGTCHLSIPGAGTTARLVVGGPSLFSSFRVAGKGVSSIFLTIAKGGLIKNRRG